MKRKRQTADETLKSTKSGKRPIKSKLALLKKGKRSKKSSNFDVEIMVHTSARPSEQDTTGGLSVMFGKPSNS